MFIERFMLLFDNKLIIFFDDDAETVYVNQFENLASNKKTILT